MLVNVVIFASILLLLALPAFFDYYIKLLASSALALAILTISWLYLERDSGWISLGHSIPFGVSAYLFAINPPLLFLSPLTALLLYPLSMLGKTLFPFATLLLSVIFWYLAHHIVIEGRGGEEGFTALSLDLNLAYVISASLFLLSYLLTWKLSNSDLGLKVKAVRDDEIAAKAIGMSPEPLKMFAFIFSCSLASMAGVLHATIFGHVSPDVFSPYFFLFPFVAAIIGGRRLWSCILGSYAVVGLSWFLSPYAPGFHYLIYAITIILASYVQAHARSNRTM
jgi:branched-chain amino acid transport system permease protein